MKKKLIVFFAILLFMVCNIQMVYATNSSNIYKNSVSNSSSKNSYTTNSTKSKNNVNGTPSVDSSEKVYDYADLFDNDEEDDLFNKINDFIDTYNIDMVIVTINENNKSSSMAYADDFYDYNDFGIGDKKNGILFLIDMDNRKIWISTTGDAIKIYKSYIDPILDDCYDYVKAEEYYDCALAFIKSSGKSYKKYKNSGWISGFVIAGIVSILIPTVFCLYKKSKHKAVKLAKNADSYLDRSTFKITMSNDRFSHSHVSKIPRVSSSSGSGGSHSGSSGTSHGGGGRSF